MELHSVREENLKNSDFANEEREVKSFAIESFRRKFRAEQVSKHYSGRLHAAFTFSFGFFGAVAPWFFLSSPSLIEILVFPVTLVYANFVEYFAHKGPMHHLKKGFGLLYERHTQTHHVFFTDQNMSYDESRDVKAVLFPPVAIVFFFGIFAIPVGILIFKLFSMNAGLFFVSAALTYYLNYEILHFVYHLPRDHFVFKIPGVRTLSAHHTFHHRKGLMTRYNFNVTYPLGDWVFGTLYRPARSEKAARYRQ